MAVNCSWSDIRLLQRCKMSSDVCLVERSRRKSKRHYFIKTMLRVPPPRVKQNLKNALIRKPFCLQCNVQQDGSLSGSEGAGALASYLLCERRGPPGQVTNQLQPLTPEDHLYSAVKLTPPAACVWTAAGSLRESTQTCKLHTEGPRIQTLDLLSVMQQCEPLRCSMLMMQTFPLTGPHSFTPRKHCAEIS